LLCGQYWRGSRRDNDIDFKSLSQFGSFLIMGLIGVAIASLVNIFLASSTLQFVVSIVGILVFIGLTAWDTQSIKEQYAENFDAESTVCVFAPYLGKLASWRRE
jgi:FtsH-binding integral membrane protein